MSKANKSPEQLLTELVRSDGRYPLEAYAFLHEGLSRAVRACHGDAAAANRPRHVSGQQLCWALRDEAVERWGLLAQTVLGRWRIRTTLDFGNMVYLLVNNNLMQKTEEDSLDDFRDVYDFRDAFSDSPSGQVNN
jgi:uncharacterized repeat protein (TIGR04138 family)